MIQQIPEVVVLRLPLYVRSLANLEREAIEVVSSRELGAQLQMTPAQIRKDLTYFGRFGKQGRGYNVAYLLMELRRILGLDIEWPMVMVGVGRLGRAILSYGRFAPNGFRVVAIFDKDAAQIGKKVGSLAITDVAELESVVRSRDVKIGIVSVPPPEAQTTIDAMVKCGIKAILNYAPIAAQVPADVKIRDIDPIVALQSLTYHLKTLDKQ